MYDRCGWSVAFTGSFLFSVETVIIVVSRKSSNVCRPCKDKASVVNRWEKVPGLYIYSVFANDTC